jgi:hypothetical protein
VANGNYASSPGQSGKYFAVTASGAQAFLGAPMNSDGTLTMTTLPGSVLSQGRTFPDIGPNGARPSVWFGQPQLPMVYGTYDTTYGNSERTRELIMTKSEFRELFQRVLNVAADNAEAKMARPISRSFLIRLHAFGYGDRLISVEEAVDKIYLGSDRFYRIIDVAIEEVLPKESVAFVRVSGHPPSTLSATWDPAGSGPFKQIVLDKIVDRRVHGA